LSGGKVTQRSSCTGGNFLGAIVLQGEIKLWVVLSYGGNCPTGAIALQGQCHTREIVLQGKLSNGGNCPTGAIVLPGQLSYEGNCLTRAIVLREQLSLNRIKLLEYACSSSRLMLLVPLLFLLLPPSLAPPHTSHPPSFLLHPRFGVPFFRQCQETGQTVVCFQMHSQPRGQVRRRVGGLG
jgi:hypothetical protein